MTSAADLALGRKLKARRIQLGLSRHGMEEITGIGRNRIARLERGEGSLKPREFAALLSGYQVVLAEWLGGTTLERATPQQLANVDLLSDGEFQAVATFIANLVAGRATRPT